MRNKKLYISMLVLVGVFLVLMYALKFYFPQEFVFAVENENIVLIGEFIDSREWLYTICCVITSSITYYLYICASSHRLKLKLYEILIIIATSLCIRLVGKYIDADLRTILSMCSFFILPAIMGADLKTLSIVYTVHSIAQYFTLKIRNLPLFFGNVPTFVSMIFMTFECYLWLVLMFIIFNYKKEK